MEPDEYQEQEDNVNVNTQTWRDGNTSNMGGDKPLDKKGENLGNMGQQSEKSPFSEDDYEKQLALRSTPEFKAGYQDLLDEMNGKKKPLEDDLLPTAKELSKRFGGSFAPILERFKEQIRFEIEDGTMSLKVPYKLRILGDQLNFLFLRASMYTNLSLKDTETDLAKTVLLELCRVDIRIKDFDYHDYDNPEGVFEESYDLIKTCREIDEDGIVVNPGFGDEWVEMKLRDEKNDRTLIVGFKAYLQVPKK